MSRKLVSLQGSGAGGAFVDGDFFKMTPHIVPTKNDLDLLMLGVVQRNLWVGGSWDALALDASATGDFDLPEIRPFQVDNTGSQISASSNLVVQVRFYVRVSNAAISVTPKVYNITDSGAATISGAAACSATAADYSGANSQQVVTLTLPAGLKTFKPQLTISGTPAAGYEAWGVAIYDCYVNG